jgi:hypothetical protein
VCLVHVDETTAESLSASVASSHLNLPPAGCGQGRGAVLQLQRERPGAFSNGLALEGMAVRDTTATLMFLCCVQQVSGNS